VLKDACTYGIQLLGTLKFDRIDIQSKVFGGANCISTLYRLLNNWAGNTSCGSLPYLAIPSPNRIDACTYGMKLLGTLNYDRIDIQSKVFDGANCISTLYRLLKNWASNTSCGS
jgi:hypothetical protein